MLKKILIVLMIVFIGGSLMCEAKALKENNWDKVFKKSNKVDVKKVNFKNRYGITLVGEDRKSVV